MFFTNKRTILCVATLVVMFATSCQFGDGSEEPVGDRGRVREMEELLSRFGPKPEIRHSFRQPEKRPPALLSDAFTILCLLPLILLFALWAAIGVNLSGFTPSLAAIAFHAGTALILALLFSAFWKNMDMFLVLKCLSGVLLMTFVSGHFLLKGFAKKRQLELSS